ncbi:hypothetical protein N9585_02900 [Amylibacter sp.]|nr:hypothetical protein [Amylibacter sp.]
MAVSENDLTDLLGLIHCGYFLSRYSGNISTSRLLPVRDVSGLQSSSVRSRIASFSID